MKRIYKSGEGRIIDGVCSGVARYFGIDAIWVRIGWTALSLAGGIGIIAYLLGMYLFPREEPGEVKGPAAASRSSGTLVSGIILISLGILLVLRAFGVLQYGFWGAWHVAWVILWPLWLIAGGLFLVFVYWRQGAREYPRLRRLPDDRIVMGVCSGLGEYLRIDPNFVRFVFALGIILSRGVGLIVYILVGLLIPGKEDEAKEA